MSTNKICDNEKKKLEKLYLTKTKNIYQKNKELRNLALKIGTDYNDNETANEYLNQITINQNDSYTEYLYLGGIYMHLGMLDKCWKYYKYRTNDPVYSTIKKKFDSNKEWNKQNIEGKNIYILMEQGIGDCIMWIRYLPLIKNANIYLYVTSFYKKIIPLLDYVLKITAANNKLFIVDIIKEYDYWIFLADLTYIFDIHFKNWIEFYTYIKPNEIYVKLWSDRLKKYNKLIGINCTGFDGSKDKRRIDFKNFKCILDIHNINFINLNINYEIDHPNVIKHNYILDQDQSFIDTVAIMKCLDLFITIDTSLVHVAGAMNIPTILLCIKDSEWRWFNSSKSPWYPSVKIFKQKSINNWDGLYDYISKNLSL